MPRLPRLHCKYIAPTPPAVTGEIKRPPPAAAYRRDPASLAPPDPPPSDHVPPQVTKQRAAIRTGDVAPEVDHPSAIEHTPVPTPFRITATLRRQPPR